MRHMRQKYGQHFLVNERVIEQIVQAVRGFKPDFLVEIGPGKGALTLALAAAGFEHFKAVEIDPEMISFLQERLPPAAGIEVIKGDFSLVAPRVLPPRSTVFVGNLPYAAAADILDTALGLPGFSSAVFMFQKEQANRIQAQPGSEFYGPLSVLSQARAEVALLCNVGKGSFNPPPKVQSAVLTFVRKNPEFISLAEWKNFKKIVQAAFLHRRKTIYNSLLLAGAEGEKLAVALARAGVTPSTRAEQISLVQYKQMAQALFSN